MITMWFDFEPKGLIFGIIYFLPLVSAVLFLAFLLVYLCNKRKNKLSPGSIKEEKLKNFKFLARVFGIIALVTLALGIGATVLLFLFINYM